jgi:beta-phosphoglucomutase-like phosphatase (HAD superfamily)
MPTYPELNLITFLSPLSTALFKAIVEGARELINDLKSCRYLKAVVNGSSKEEIETVFDENIGSNNFDFAISGDD